MDMKGDFFMARYKVEIANVNTANIKVLTNEEMKELFIKMKEGNPFAKDDLVNGNLKLVLSILKKYNNRCDNMDDLFQVGCVGLIKAIDNFDLAHEVKFSTYAVPMILGEIKRYLRDNSSVRVARSIKDTAYKILKEKESFIRKYGREATNREIANILKIDEYEVVSSLDSLKDAISIYDPIYNDGGDTIYLVDQLEDKGKSTSSLDIRIDLKDALTKLKPKEEYILKERFFIGKTQVELSEEIGISQAQISRIEKSGLKQIKKIMNSK